MPAGEAVQTYSILTIGDGLVAQIPALLISISAGMVVTRVASEDGPTNIGSDIAGQILAQPKAIGVASVILLVMGLVPGMPKFAFLLLTVVTGGVSYGLFRAKKLKEESIEKEKQGYLQVAPPPTPEIDLARTFPLIFEVGGDLAPLVAISTKEGREYFDKLVRLRNLLYNQLGVVFPPLRVDRVQVAFEEENNYRFWLNEAPLRTGRIRPDRLLVSATVQQLSDYGIEAEATTNPSNHQAASWINKTDKERVLPLGLKIWDIDEILLLEISAFLRKNAMHLVTIQEVQWMVNQARKFYQTLVDEVVPKTVSLQQLTEILQKLLNEQVPIKDFNAILQAIAEWNRVDSGDIAMLTEHVRLALRRRICFGISGTSPRLVVYQLDPALEDMIRDSIREGPAGAFLAMDQDQNDLLIEAIQSGIGDVSTRTQNPVLVVDAAIRRFIKPALGSSFPELHALSYNELASEIAIEPVGIISSGPPPAQEEEQLALT